ncbi:MAG: BON domain-containing protein, partial [Vicinamibacterales bacterium]
VMSERNKRGRRREHGSYREPREFSERQFGRDEPWREERRARHPDELYGGERDPSRRPSSYGHGYGYGFGDSGSYSQPSQPRRGSDSYRREDDPQWNRGAWERDRDPSREDRDGRWDRGQATGGYGSEYSAWRSGASFGFGPEEEPRRGADEFEDTDWMPNRPARGRGSWAGNWSTGRTGAGESGSQYGGSYSNRSPGRPGDASPMRDDYRGRGPKDYRRSDDRIREEICDRLTDDHAVDASEVSIRVDAGEVTLSGFVATRDQKRRAEESAERVSGVRDVINQLRVNRGETQSPQQTQQSQQQGNRGQRSSSTVSPPSVAADRER